MSEHNDFESNMIIAVRHVAEALIEQNRINEELLGIIRRLDALEQHFSEQGINDLAQTIERRIVSRLRYGRNPRIETHWLPAEQK